MIKIHLEQLKKIVSEMEQIKNDELMTEYVIKFENGETLNIFQEV